MTMNLELRGCGSYSSGKYTPTVAFLVREGYAFPQNYPLPARYKPVFESTFTSYYWQSEICYDNPSQWLQRLQALLNLKGEYYGKLLQIEDTKYDPLLTRQLRIDGCEDIGKLNRHTLENLRKELAKQYDRQAAAARERFTRNEEETGETTEDKQSHTDGTLDKEVDTTKDTDRQTDTVENVTEHETTHKEGESEKVSHLEETTDTYSLHRYADTPENNIALGGGTGINPMPQYLTYAEDTQTNTDHEADSTENITNTEDIDRDLTRDTTTDEHMVQKEVGNEVTDQDTTEDYEHGIQGTHHFVNDQFSGTKSYNQENRSSDSDTQTNTSLREAYKSDEQTKHWLTYSGFEGIPASQLINEWMNATHNIIERFVLEFESIFMGVL